MCFTIDSKLSKPKITDGYTYVIKKGRDISEGHSCVGDEKVAYFCSEIMKHCYIQEDYQPYINLVPRVSEPYPGQAVGDAVIEAGYHSYHTMGFREDEIKDIGIFVIPPNYDYYISGSLNEVVSSEIIFRVPFYRMWNKIKSIRPGVLMQLEGTSGQLYISVEWELNPATNRKRKRIFITNKLLADIIKASQKEEEKEEEEKKTY